MYKKITGREKKIRKKRLPLQSQLRKQGFEKVSARVKFGNHIRQYLFYMDLYNNRVTLHIDIVIQPLIFSYLSFHLYLFPGFSFPTAHTVDWRKQTEK